MRSSYKKEDVVLLLKDITGLVKPQPASERERLIQSGKHYCEMLPIEYVPSEKYMQAYEEALEVFAEPTARAVEVLAEKIVRSRGRSAVLVSLARAGIPAGILLKRYLKWNAGIDMAHYAVSVIRGRGIDKNAMRYLLARYQPQQLLFIDGWIGKGAILQELKKSMADFAGVSPELAVLADPANVTALCGTHEDILIPSSCLNCTVSGLISRTFLRNDIIGKKDFHGAVYYGELEQADLSYAYIKAVEKHFTKRAWEAGPQSSAPLQEPGQDSRMEGLEAGLQNSMAVQKRKPGSSREAAGCGMDEVLEIARHFSIEDINLIKPGIGETTRVLLRRVPWKVLASHSCRKDRRLQHIFRLAQEKGVPVETYPLRRYQCCGIIKKLSDV